MANSKTNRHDRPGRLAYLPSIRRYARWAVQSVYDRTLRPRLPRKIGCYNGIPARGPRLLDSHDHVADHEALCIDGLRALVDRGDDVCIVGGGVGISAVVAARETGPDGRVHVYEAASDRIEALAETLDMNGVTDRVTIHEAVVGESDGGEDVIWGRSTTNHVRPSELPECDVLELDCEGAELSILRQLSMDRRPRAVVVETHGCYGSPTDEVRSELATLGYDVEDVGGEGDPSDDIRVLRAERRV